MGVGVGERAETVVILLAGGIPEGELDVLAVDLDVGDVVLEDGGDVDLEGVSAVAWEGGRWQLSAAPVPRAARLTQLRDGACGRAED